MFKWFPKVKVNLDLLLLSFQDLKFYQNDLLEFVYDWNKMSVIQVNKNNFEDYCNPENPIHIWLSGTGTYVVPLSETGQYYFISGSEYCFEDINIYVYVLIRPPSPSSASSSLSPLYTTLCGFLLYVLCLGAVGYSHAWI
ncbi:hypothetical protein MKX03_030913 [Papaver bracteatum]|nr:hypothetical protein MKX03_030913 [Papaver bracteatum]